MEINKENKKDTKEKIKEIKQRKDVKKLTAFFSVCIGIAVALFVITAIFMTLGFMEIISIDFAVIGSQILLPLVGVIFVISLFIHKRRDVLINRIIQFKLIEANQEIKEAQLDDQPFNILNDETQTIVAEEREKDKTPEEIKGERKALAEKLIRYNNKRMLYSCWFIIFMTALALMLVFAPVLDLFGLEKISLFDYLKEDLLREEFIGQGTLNKISFYAFIAGLFFVVIYLVIAFFMSFQLPNRSEKLRNAIENPEKNYFIDVKSNNAISKTTKIEVIVSTVLFWSSIYACLLLMPTLVILDNKEIIYWVVVIFDLVVLLLSVMILSAQYYLAKELEPEEESIMTKILYGKGIEKTKLK